MRKVLVVVTIAVVILPACAEHQAKQEQIPFVGCPADGQTGPIEAPQGLPKSMVLDKVSAEGIAYYKSAQSGGVYGPRGWHCRAWYGSSGTVLVVTPESIDSVELSPTRIRGQAIEAVFRSGGTSGRFDVATYASRLFPEPAHKFIQKIKDEGLVPASQFEQGSYANDSVKYPSPLIAEFTTPANTQGLGTEGYLDPSPDAISGIAVLDESDPEWPDLSIIRVRLGAGMHEIATSLLRLNKECVQGNDGC